MTKTIVPETCPHLLVVIGPNGSGKSSIISSIKNDLPVNHPLKKLRMVNADIAEAKIDEISAISDAAIRSREAQKWCDRERKDLRRVARRVSEGGHSVNPDKVVSRYHRTMNFLPQFVAASDIALVIDNSIDDAPYRSLLKVSQDGTIKKHENCKKVRWIHTYLFDKQN